MLGIDPIVYGRFLAAAWPWARIGGNVVPGRVVDKTPAIEGWGATCTRDPAQAGAVALRWCGVRGPLHSEDSPRLPGEAYAEWAGGYRDAIALVFPATVGATVVDVDDPGLLEGVLRVCGDTPFRTISGRVGGGIHLWYGGVSGSENGVAPGVDVKSTGGYVVTPGSMHASGREYQASEALALALIAGVRPQWPGLPAGWRDRLRALGVRKPDPTHADLGALVDRFKKRRETKTAALLDAVYGRRVFAPDGERRPTLTHLLGIMYREWPWASEDSIAALFAGSLEALAADGSVLTNEDCLRRYWQWLAGAAAAGERAQADADALRRRAAWRWVEEERDDPISEVGRTPIVVTCGKAVMVRVGTHWAGPWADVDLNPATLGSLSALYGIDAPDRGALLAGWGERASRLEYSFQVDRTQYVDGVITIATAPMRRDLVGERSEAVERLVNEIGGVYARQLWWWLASFAQDGPCRALLLSGPKHTGKSLLTSGVGRLWRDGAAKMRDVLGRKFNSEIASSRLAVADDDTGEAEAGQALAAYLREAVNDRVQRIERKHQDVGKVRGSMRYAVATNDLAGVLRGVVSSDLNDESLDAFADRILHIPVGEGARGCWERCGLTPRELVEGDAIARHVLWLGEQVRNGGLGAMGGDRFWVGAGDVDWIELAKISTGLRGEILIRLHQEIENGNIPVAADLGKRSHGLGAWITIPNADTTSVEVSAAGMHAQWGQDRPRHATVRTIGSALRALAFYSSTKTRTHRISLDIIQRYADYCGV